MRPGKRDLVMAAELLHDLMRRSGELTREEKLRLARFLSEQLTSNGDEETTSPKLPSADPRKGQLAVGWLKSHADEYEGQYVALDGDQLVGSGRTIGDAQADAKRNGYQQVLLVQVPPREGGNWGGW